MLSPYQLYYGEESMVCAMRTEVLPCIVLLRATRRCWQKSYLVERADDISMNEWVRSSCLNQPVSKNCENLVQVNVQSKIRGRDGCECMHEDNLPVYTCFDDLDPFFKVTGIKKIFLPFPVWMQVDWMFPLLGFVDLPNDFSGNCFLLVPWLGFGG